MLSSARQLLIAFLLLGLPGLHAAGDDGATVDLGVSNLSRSETARPGSEVTFTIKAVNAGPGSAEDARLDDELPGGTSFVSLSSPAGWTCLTPEPGASGGVACTGAHFAVTEGDEFKLVLRVEPWVSPGAYITDTATISSGAADPNDENNSATTSVRVALPND
jgi:uncharacterized repeat protein (TIGR01451 family)